MTHPAIARRHGATTIPGVLIPGALTMAIALATPTALAHDPDQSNIAVAQCWRDGDAVVCQSGRAISGGWSHAPVRVFAHDGTMLLLTGTDKQGRVRFDRPAGACYLLIGDQPGQVIEVEWRDVDAGTPWPGAAP